MAVTVCRALREMLAVLMAQRVTSPRWWPPPLPLGPTPDLHLNSFPLPSAPLGVVGWGS